MSLYPVIPMLVNGDKSMRLPTKFNAVQVAKKLGLTLDQAKELKQQLIKAGWMFKE